MRSENHRKKGLKQHKVWVRTWQGRVQGSTKRLFFGQRIFVEKNGSRISEALHKSRNEQTMKAAPYNSWSTTLNWLWERSQNHSKKMKQLRVWVRTWHGSEEAWKIVLWKEELYNRKRKQDQWSVAQKQCFQIHTLDSQHARQSL